MATFDEVQRIVLARHAGNAQRHGLALIHLEDLGKGLAGLAALGEHLSIEFGGKPEAVEYPKMLYHSKETEPRVVGGEEEEKEARRMGWNEFPGGIPPAGGKADTVPGVVNPPVSPAPPPTVRIPTTTAGISTATKRK